MPTQAEIYGYGTLANVLCCVCSLGGAVIFPCASRYKKVYHIVISLFMGLAVGTLGSDALLHLIPEALGIHGHEDEHSEGNGTVQAEEDEDREGRRISVEPYVWFMMVTMAGAYGFYLLEMIMTFIQNETVKKDKELSTPVISAFTITTGNSSSSVNKLEESTISNGTVEYQMGDDPGGQSTGLETIIPYISTVTSFCILLTGFTPLVIMIIVGDALHNFADGLAIAASFSKSNIEGLSTSIAIFCHELPHELGDFAILLTSGMGFCKALLANLFSSITALIGFYVGVPISTDETSRQWIFALTAGMFLYIALVDIMPQITKLGAQSFKTFMCHNTGILLGALLIVLLGIFEEHIEI